MNIMGFFGNFFEGPNGIILLLIVLLLFGAKKLPELARGLGQAINEFNKAKDDVHRQITQSTETPSTPATPASPAPSPVSQQNPPGSVAQQAPPPQEQAPKS